MRDLTRTSSELYNGIGGLPSRVLRFWEPWLVGPQAFTDLVQTQ